MNKYYFVFFIWLLPAYFLFQGGYQLLIFQGLNTTYDNGTSYVADVIDFDVKQIAAQTNGYVVLRFETDNNGVIEEQLALPVQMAQVIMNSELIPVRYNSSSFSPIVMIPIFELQKSVIKVNLGVTGFGFIVTILVALWASKFARNKIKNGEEELEFERMDTDES